MLELALKHSDKGHAGGRTETILSLAMVELELTEHYSDFGHGGAGTNRTLF